jgi:hypothetical protein
MCDVVWRGLARVPAEHAQNSTPPLSPQRDINLQRPTSKKNNKTRASLQLWKILADETVQVQLGRNSGQL